MTEEEVEMTIRVSDEDMAAEIGAAMLGRAIDKHEGPEPVAEDTAEELRDLAWDILEEYE